MNSTTSLNSFMDNTSLIGEEESIVMPSSKLQGKIALLRQNYQHLRSLLIDVMHTIVGIGLKMQIIFVVDLQERTTVHTIGVDAPQWLVYCFIDPIRNFFH